MAYLIYPIFIILCSIIYVASIRELCHPQCYVKCLPSCKCCDSKQNVAMQSFDAYKRNEIRLKHLGRMLLERDLIIGFSCDPYCRKRCVPSCKFSCCGTNAQPGYQSDMLLANSAKRLGEKEEFSLKRLVKAIEDTQSEYLKLKEFINKVNSTIQKEENLPEAVVINTNLKMPELTSPEGKEKSEDLQSTNNLQESNDKEKSDSVELPTEHSQASNNINAKKQNARKKHAGKKHKNEHNSINRVYETIQTLQEKIAEEVKRRKLREKDNSKKTKSVKHKYLVEKLKALMDAKDKLKSEFLKTTNYDKASSLQKVDEELEKAAKAYEVIKLKDNAMRKMSTNNFLERNPPALKKVLGNIEAGHNSIILEVIDGSGTQLSEIRVKKSKKRNRHGKRKRRHRKKKLKRKDSTKKKIEKLLKTSSCTEEMCKDGLESPCCNSYTQSTNIPVLPILSNAKSYQPNQWLGYKEHSAQGVDNTTTVSYTNQNISPAYNDIKQSPYGYSVNASVSSYNNVAATNQNSFTSLSQQQYQPSGYSFSISPTVANLLLPHSAQNKTVTDTVTGRRTDTPDDTKEQIQTLISLLQNTMKQFDNKQVNVTNTCSDECKKQCLPDCHFQCC